MGWYHYWRLQPFTLDEIPDGITSEDAFKRLMTVGGFSEPFLDKDERNARRWRRERFDRAFHENVRDLQNHRGRAYILHKNKLVTFKIYVLKIFPVTTRIPRITPKLTADARGHTQTFLNGEFRILFFGVNEKSMNI